MNHSLEDVVNKNLYEDERLLLGSVFIDSKSILDVIDIVEPESFELLENQYIYQSMLDLYNSNTAIDFATIKNILAAKKQLGLIGENYIHHFINVIPTSTFAADYAKMIAERYHKRRIVQIANTIKNKAESAKSTVKTLLELFESELLNLAKSTRTTNVVRLDAILDTAIQRLDSEIDLRGIPTGFIGLDNFTGGFNNSDLIILAARPGMGKSALALDFATSAIKQDKVVLFFSLEMGANDLTDRLLAAESGINSFLFRNNNLNSNQIEQAKAAIERLKPYPLFIETTPLINIGNIKTAAKRQKLKVGLDMLIIDYLTLIDMSGNKNLVQQIADVTRGLKVLAKELDIPIILLSQLSRNCELRNPKNKRPLLIDLRDSGAIEQDADIVLMLYRDSYYRTLAYDQPDITELLIRKNRNGESGKTVKLRFNTSTQSYEQYIPPREQVVENTNLLD